MPEYKGSILGFNYLIEKETDEEFKIWLKAKLKRYVLKDLEKEIVKDLLGVTALKESIILLKGRIKQLERI